MAEQDLIKEEEEKKKKELEAQKDRQQAISITSADKNFFNNKQPEKENKDDKEEQEQEPKVPDLPEPDFTSSKKCKTLSKYFETSSYFAKVLTWILVPLTIGAFATGLGIVATILMVLTVVSIGFVYGGGELKDIFEDYALKDEKAAVKANAPKLQEYYKKCEELNIEPLSPNKDLPKDDKDKIKAAQQRAIDQTYQQQQQKPQQTEQSK